MKPVVLIATHNRVDITKRNIESLLRQSVKPFILLVCSEKNECDEFNDIDDVCVFAIIAPNKPLGAKWQNGVMYDFLGHKSNPLIITGSDDILGDGFIENACRLIEQGNHFIGLRQWWQHHEGRAYLCKYMARNNWPLGGGRVYSAEMLKAINYKVFDTKADKHLDDYGWQRVQRSRLKHLVLDNPQKEGLSIHAIKGDWPMMNPFTLNHKNITLLSSITSKQALPSFFNEP